ncbi:MAG: 4Fe-4S binding protein [Candidatus Diapherotrites archaeon]|uniref:4Fe-4S binding protein n=1 Tax=Candidatus Iainarchaeum sp. TaxID=3101447 RepID=A0A938YWQ0_9ARCH|nr:4Fe-4S binding protein [Candidatus Diapherotrites archaeon]
MTAMLRELLKQLFKRPFTNKFPSKRIPESVNGFLEKAEKGKAKINPAIPVPEGFRGRIEYYREKCIGCQLCTKVCPADAIVFLPKEKKVEYHLFRCSFCGQCVEICPVKALEFTKEFLLADYKKD